MCFKVKIIIIQNNNNKNICIQQIKLNNIGDNIELLWSDNINNYIILNSIKN